MTAPKRFRWFPATQLVTKLKHLDGRHLAISVTGVDGDEWSAVAFEVPKGVKLSAEALEHHSHKMLGTFAHLTAAMAAGEDYARTWLLGTTAAEPCPCDEIGAPA